jgi:hypothetical protein
MVPEDMKKHLTELKMVRKEQTAALRSGSQKAFFARVWERLHTDDGEHLVDSAPPSPNHVSKQFAAFDASEANGSPEPSDDAKPANTSFSQSDHDQPALHVLTSFPRPPALPLVSSEVEIAPSQNTMTVWTAPPHFPVRDTIDDVDTQGQDDGNGLEGTPVTEV